jgi:DNA-binding NarL/FixJ family response regulator
MNPTILIVEDHPTLREALRRLLQLLYPGDVILEAASLETALEQVQAACPWLILMDIERPYRAGLEATRRVRSDHPETLVIILTVYEDDQHRAAATQAGADGFVAKSRLMVDLVPTLTAFGRGSSGPSSI